MSFELKKDNSFVRKMAREFDNGLRKCPFCGGKGGADTGALDSEEEAIKAWNRRASDETTNRRP